MIKIIGIFIIVAVTIVAIIVNNAYWNREIKKVEDTFDEQFNKK